MHANGPRDATWGTLYRMKVLLAEDDKSTSEFITLGLTEAGHNVVAVNDGREALSACLHDTFDLAILDRMMPGLDGLSVLRSLRAAKCAVPVIFLTAVSDVGAKVEGLEAGADDYLAKPFHMAELLARVGSVTRRPAGDAPPTTLGVHDLTLDLLTRTAERRGEKIELLDKEFRILEILMRNPGRIATRVMLLDRVWNLNFDPGTSVVETHISRLRSKIDKPFEEKLIHTHRNAGYSIRAPL